MALTERTELGYELRIPLKVTLVPNAVEDNALDMDVRVEMGSPRLERLPHVPDELRLRSLHRHQIDKPIRA